MPAKLIFKAEEGKMYPVIFKHGDDLRQDQLILQIISLMDKLLRKENLDLKLTPYKVLATSTKHGFMQFVQSVPVAEVLATEGNNPGSRSRYFCLRAYLPLYRILDVCLPSSLCARLCL
uniref:PI3K/PI4K catalytic domain-containing protein n=1 Tax=Oncorhynchus tshawytscha TaxID=74940 RepID=A0A8C8CXM3_ONCTS